MYKQLKAHSLVEIYIKDRSFLVKDRYGKIVEREYEDQDQLKTLLVAAVSVFNPDEVHYYIAGEHLFAETAHIFIEKDQEFVVTEELIYKEITHALEKFKERFPNSEYEIISNHIIHSELNGYVISDVLNKKGFSLKLKIFLAALPSSYKTTLAGLFNNDVPKNMKHFSPYVLKVSDLIFQKSKNENFLLCSVYEDTIDLSIKKEKGFFETINLPLGKNIIIDAIEKELNVTKEIALSFVSLYSEEKLSKDMKIKVDAVLKEFNIRAEKEINKFLSGSVEGILLPDDVYIVSSRELNKIYAEFFKTGSYHSSAFTSLGFRALFLNEQDIISAKIKI